MRAQPVSFASGVYPILEKAGCRDCHNVEGVASPTRLRFPESGTPATRVEAFGRSLVEFVDPKDPMNSVLLRKPTNRVPHTGGERIAKGSADESALRAWIGVLAALRGPELTAALRYKQEEAAGHGTAPKAVLRRLTHSQYNNTLRDLLNDSTDPANNFPSEDYVNGFKNQYEALSISPLQAEAYGIAAEKAAAHAFRRGDSHGLLPCKPTSETDPVCRAKFVTVFGRKAFRRPLEREEQLRYEAIFKNHRTFLAGAQGVIEAMLQSPAFLFWLDQTPNPKWKPYAAASRLSYFLWNTMPDESLLDSAAKGQLNESVIRRMLNDPKARAGFDEFAAQWLRFDRVISASRERRAFPLFSGELARSMVEESRRFLGDLVWNDRNFMEAFTANHTFVNSGLAAVYKISPPARDFDRVEYPPASGRAGLLGHASFLTLTSKPDDTAPTGRGLFIREQFLCQQVPPPPPGVDTNLPPVEEGKPVTNRERLALHTTNETCVSCHKLIDPIGFGFEKFDAIGMWREKHVHRFQQGGNTAAARRAPPKIVELEIDTQGNVAGIENSAFTEPRALGELLAKTPQCQECTVKQLFRYMAGRMDTPADRSRIAAALDVFRKSGFRFRELMIYLVKSDEGVGNAAIHR